MKAIFMSSVQRIFEYVGSMEAVIRSQGMKYLYMYIYLCQI